MSRAPVADSPRALDTAPVKDVPALPENPPDIARQPAGRSPEGSAGVARTYRGRTMEELIPRIQRELGSDPIILRRREGLAGGLAGFFQRPFVEIEATPGGPRVDLYDEEDAPPTREAGTPRPSTAANPRAVLLARARRAQRGARERAFRRARASGTATPRARSSAPRQRAGRGISRAHPDRFL